MPPPNKQNGFNIDDQWPTFLANFTTAENDIIVVGDINFHLDNLSNPNTEKFKSVLEACGILQHVTEPTHVVGHIKEIQTQRYQI
jgi:hypothetical protein